MFRDKRLTIVAPLAGTILAWFAAAALAQEAETAPASAPASAPAGEQAIVVGDKKLAELWDDFLHYVRIANADAAKSFGDAILGKNPQPLDMYALATKTSGSQETLDRAARLSEPLKKIVEGMRKQIELGYQADRSNPEMIQKAIDGLGGQERQYQNSFARLLESGEYALPQMIQKLGAPNTSSDMKQRIVNVLLKMGRTAVNGLAAALETNSPDVQDLLVGALGKIGYQNAAPALKELSLRKGVLDRVRDSAEKALSDLLGQDGAKKSLAELAYQQAQKYYAHEQSLMPDARATTANVWSWQEGLGLTYKPVPAEIFPDVYSMRYARMALQSDPKYYPAMSQWLAADLRREAELPAGAKDPTVPADMPTAKFFALASPPQILQEVLLTGLKQKNPAVILGAMDALVRTQGAKSLVQPAADGAQPLVEALSYPDKNIRFMAAVSLANAQPDKRFTGSDLVVTVLNEALRQTAKKSAIVCVESEQVRNGLMDALRGAGYEAVDQSDVAKALAAAKSAGALDVLVLDGKAADEIVPALRKDPLLASLPAVVVTDEEGVRAQFKNDTQVVLMAASEKLDDALAKASKLGSGEPLTPEQMTAWAVRAADAVRLLGLTGNPVYDLNRVRPTLIAALAVAQPELQLAAARALAVMSAADAQQAIALLALKPELDEKTRIAALGVLTESVRRFGNQLTESQVDSLSNQVISAPSEALKEAAAQAWGSLNLPSEKSKTLILQFGESKPAKE